MTPKSGPRNGFEPWSSASVVEAHRGALFLKAYTQVPSSLSVLDFETFLVFVLIAPSHVAPSRACNYGAKGQPPPSREAQEWEQFADVECLAVGFWGGAGWLFHGPGG